MKLMVPGELARVAAHARYAYEDRSDCPPGIQPTDTVEFEVELLKFVREGHWQVGSRGSRGMSRGLHSRGGGMNGALVLPVLMWQLIASSQHGL